MTLQRIDFLAAIGLAVMGLAIMAHGYSYGVMVDGVPGAGLFPLLAGALIATLSIVNVFRIGRKLDVLSGRISLRQLRPVCGISTLLILYTVASPYLGLILPLPFVLVAMSYLVEPRPGARWFFQIVGLSVFLSIGCYLLFGRLLGVLLPIGPLGF